MDSIIKNLARWLRSKTPIWRNWQSFHITWEYVSFWQFLWKQVFPIFKNKLYYPYDKNSTVCGNLLIGKNVKLTQRGGCYIQGWGKVFIGDYVEIAQNCIVISENHSLTNQREHIKKETIIGDHCWIASNAAIMSGVVLGPRTVVAAGSVVTKSFPEGFVLIGGNPARVIKDIPKNEFIPRHFKYEMYGWIPANKFAAYKSKHLQHLKFNYDLNSVSSNRELIEGSVLSTNENDMC